MFSAQAFQVGGMGGPGGMGCGVVDVGVLGGPVAAGEAAGQIAAADETLQLPRGSVAGVAACTRWAQGLDGGAGVDQLGQQRSRDHATADDDRRLERGRGLLRRSLPLRPLLRLRLVLGRRCRGLILGRLRPGRFGLQGGGVEGGFVGQDVDDHGTGVGFDTCCLAIGVAAVARQPIRAGEHRAERIRAAFPHGAGIVRAHGAADLVEGALQQHGVGAQQPTPQRGGAGLVVRFAHLHVTAAGSIPELPACLRIMLGQHRVDGQVELMIREHTPGGGTVRDRRVDTCDGGAVGDQLGAPGDRRGHPQTQRARIEELGGPGQTFIQCFGQAHLRGGAPVADPRRTRHLGGRGIPVIARPHRPVVVRVVGAALHQFSDRRQPVRRPRSFGACPTSDRRDDGGVINVGEHSTIRQIIEHVFEYRFDL